jgi:hypothetical protein
MPLTAGERKERLGHGAITKIARKLRLSISHVSQVNRLERHDRRVEREIARRLEMSEYDAGFPGYEPQYAGAR